MTTGFIQRTALGWLAFLAIGWPSLAWACPFCASGRQPPGVSALIMGITVLPFLIVGTVLRAALRTAHDLDGVPDQGLPSVEDR